jgi:D-3-phosphoglycerate dehydrogenase
MEHGYAKAGLAGLKEYQGDPDAIADFVGDARILVDHLAPVTGPMLERLPRLELIAVSRGGPVNLDMAACRARGVKVVNTPGRNAPAVAEFTIGAILAETRLIREGHESLRRGEWRGDLYRSDLTGDELADLTVGVIGYGHIGTRVVRYLKVFGPRILVHDPYVPLRPEDAADGVEAVGLDELLRRSDVVTLHPRVTPETTRMINADTLARMKPGSYLINTARGGLVVEADLAESLASGHLAGAGLDVLNAEPPEPGNPLLALPNVVFSPHMGGVDRKSMADMAEMAAGCIVSLYRGEWPSGCIVNDELAEGWRW